MYCDVNEAIAELQSGVTAPTHGVVTPKVCPAGFFCPNGTVTDREFPCPVGTYSNTTGLESLAECRLCPPGMKEESWFSLILYSNNNNIVVSNKI